MAEHTPTERRAEFDRWLAEFNRWLAEARREAAEKAAVEVGVCEHQNANYLRMMSERDELRDVVRELDAVMHHHAERADVAEAEVERLREDYQAACEARMTFHDELDEAQRQLADLRAGIEALADTKPGATGRALRDLLAGSGEQPGEVEGYCTCHDDQKGRTRDCGVKVHREAGRSAPVTPDSADVREGEGDPPHLAREWAALSTQERAEVFAWFTRPLAAVGQGVTAEPGKWWRVIAPDGSLWCETSIEREARAAMRPGDSLLREWVYPGRNEYREEEGS